MYLDTEQLTSLPFPYSGIPVPYSGIPLIDRRKVNLFESGKLSHFRILTN